MPSILGADYWRQRAQETRTKAEHMDDPTARQALLQLAENYEQLVQQAETSGKTNSRKQ
jgi:hypothetical protein